MNIREEKAKEKYKDKLKESGKITKEEEISQRRIKQRPSHKRSKTKKYMFETQYIQRYLSS